MYNFNGYNRIPTKDVDLAIKAVSNYYNSKRALDALHLTMDVCARHGEEHGKSWDKLTNLTKALQNNVNKRGMGLWIAKFLPGLEWKRDKGGDFKWIGAANYDPRGFEEPFYRMGKEEREVTPFSFVTYIMKGLDKESKKLEKASKNAEAVPAAEVELFQAIRDVMTKAAAAADEAAKAAA